MQTSSQNIRTVTIKMEASPARRKVCRTLTPCEGEFLCPKPLASAARITSTFAYPLYTDRKDRGIPQAPRDGPDQLRPGGLPRPAEAADARPWADSAPVSPARTRLLAAGSPSSVTVPICMRLHGRSTKDGKAVGLGLNHVPRRRGSAGDPRAMTGSRVFLLARLAGRPASGIVGTPAGAVLSAFGPKSRPAPRTLPATPPSCCFRGTSCTGQGTRPRAWGRRGSA